MEKGPELMCVQCHKIFVADIVENTITEQYYIVVDNDIIGEDRTKYFCSEECRGRWRRNR